MEEVRAQMVQSYTCIPIGFELGQLGELFRGRFRCAGCLSSSQTQGSRCWGFAVDTFHLKVPSQVSCRTRAFCPGGDFQSADCLFSAAAGHGLGTRQLALLRWLFIVHAGTSSSKHFFLTQASFRFRSFSNSGSSSSQLI